MHPTSWTWAALCLVAALALGAGGSQADEGPVAPPGAPPAGSAAPPSGAPAAAASEGQPASPLPPSVVPPSEQQLVDQLLPRGEGLRSLTLAEAVRMALRANLPLLAGSYDPAIANERRVSAEAIFDPLVSAEFDYAHSEEPVTSAFFGRPVITDNSVGAGGSVSKLLPTGGTLALLYRADRLDTDSQFTTLNPSWTQSTVLQGTQPLLRGAGDVVLTEIRRARNGILIAQDQQRARVENVLLEVVAAYWDLLYAQDLVLARKKSEEVAQELLRDAQARLDAKVGTPLDVAEARAGLERRRGDRFTAEGDRANTQDVLRLLVLPFARGDKGVAFRAVDDPDLESAMAPEMGQLERYVETALSNRPEIRAGRADIFNRDLDVFAAGNEVLPQLDLVASAGTAALRRDFGDSVGDMVTGEALSASLGLRFSMYIGRKAAKANLRLAEWARRQSVIQLREEENRVVGEVRAALREVLTTQAREQAGREEVRASTEDVRGERSLLDNGKSTPYRVLQKEDDLTTARTRLARATADRRIAEGRFWRSIGLLSDRLGVRNVVLPPR